MEMAQSEWGFQRRRAWVKKGDCTAVAFWYPARLAVLSSMLITEEAGMSSGEWNHIDMIHLASLTVAGRTPSVHDNNPLCVVSCADTDAIRNRGSPERAWPPEPGANDTNVLLGMWGSGRSTHTPRVP